MEIIYGDGSELAFAHDMEQTLLSMNDFNSGAFKGSHEEGKIDLEDRALWIRNNREKPESRNETIGWDTAWILYPDRSRSMKEDTRIRQVTAKVMTVECLDDTRR